MSNSFSGFGNIGQAPNLRSVKVAGESRNVLDLRVYFDRRVPKGDGEFEDEGGFWMSVSYWGARGEATFKCVQKGTRIRVDGTLRQEAWEDDDGQNRREMRLTADSLTIDPICIDTITFRAPRGRVPDLPPDDGGVDEAA